MDLLEYPEQDELELQAISGATFAVRREHDLLLAFDVAAELSEVELEQAELESDGTILIDETHNVALRLVFEANIECSLDLFEDTNGSGALEAHDKHIAGCAKN